MYAGEYGYNSGPSWEVMPKVTLGTSKHLEIVEDEDRRLIPAHVKGAISGVLRRRVEPW